MCMAHTLLCGLLNQCFSTGISVIIVTILIYRMLRPKVILER